MSKPIYWITGASSGIGLALVQHYIKTEPQAVIVASSRSQDKLEEAFSTYQNVFILPVDITTETAVDHAAAIIEQQFGYISHLFLNAGNCEYIDELPLDTALIKRIIDVNLMGSIHCINSSLRLLEKSPSRAQIIGIGSQVIFAPFARAEAYGASKAAFDYLLQSLRIDLLAKQIDVTLIYPGFIKTPLTDKNDFPMPFLLSSDKAARHIAYATKKRKRQYSFPKRLRTLLFLSRLLPKHWDNLMEHNS